MLLYSDNQDGLVISDLELSRNNSDIEFSIKDPKNVKFIYIKYGKLKNGNCDLKSTVVSKDRPVKDLEMQLSNNEICIKLLDKRDLDIDYIRISISDNSGNYSNSIIYDMHDKYYSVCKE